MEYYLDIKQDAILPFATTWMDLEGIMLSELSEKDKMLYFITYMWNLKNKANEWIQQNRNQLTERTNWWLPVGRQKGGRAKRVQGQKVHTSMYKTNSPQGHIYSRGKQPLFIAALSGVQSTGIFNQNSCTPETNKIL